MGYFPSNPARFNGTVTEIWTPNGVVQVVIDPAVQTGLTVGAISGVPNNDLRAQIHRFAATGSTVDQTGTQVEVNAGAGLDAIVASNFQVPGVNALILPDFGRAFKRSVATADATVTNCGTYTPANGTVTSVWARVTGFDVTTPQGAAYIRAACFRKAAGVLTLIGAVAALYTAEDNAAWDCTIDQNAGVIRIRVTGQAATAVNWDAYWLIAEET